MSGFRRSNVSRIGGFMKSTLHELGVEGKILERQVIGKWKQIVGPQIAASTRADSIREGVLFVCCKSSMWSNELVLHKTEIMKKLNATAGKNIVKDIRFSARGFRKEEAKKQGERSAPVDSIALDASETKEAKETASVCESDELSKKVMQAVMTSKRLRELKLREGFRPCKKCGELHNGKHDTCDSCRTML